jgi:hypothetical protein
MEMKAMDDLAPAAPAPIGVGVGLGDKVVLIFGDDQKRVSVRLSEAGHDLDSGTIFWLLSEGDAPSFVEISEAVAANDHATRL